MPKCKRILVTSGGTQEYIDDVRVLTNISSGKLGWEIADTMVRTCIKHYVDEVGMEDYLKGGSIVDVTYLHGRNAYIFGGRAHVVTPVEVRTAQDACNAMKKLVPKMDAVIHCMAVSDFTFKRRKAIKCKSSDPQAFIDYMRDTITPNPKIISMVKKWNPKTLLVGFKFEVGIPHKELIALARASIEKNGCDIVVANDKAEMEREKEHVAYIVCKDNDKPVRVMTKRGIAKALAEMVVGRL